VAPPIAVPMTLIWPLSPTRAINWQSGCGPTNHWKTPVNWSLSAKIWGKGVISQYGKALALPRHRGAGQARIRHGLPTELPA